MTAADLQSIKDGLERRWWLEKENERLHAALKECADRFERCIIASGSDAEHAANAVKRYRRFPVYKGPRP